MQVNIDIEEIQKVLPQRFPFLFIDRIIELEPGKKVIAFKNISINEGYFSGHFPGNAVMPGALIIEAMAQASIFIYYSAYKDNLQEMPKYYLGSVKSRFFHPATPGDKLKIIAETVKLLPTGAFVNVKGFVEDKIIAETDLVFAVKT